MEENNNNSAKVHPAKRMTRSEFLWHINVMVNSIQDEIIELGNQLHAVQMVRQRAEQAEDNGLSVTFWLVGDRVMFQAEPKGEVGFAHRCDFPPKEERDEQVREAPTLPGEEEAAE